MIYLNLSLKFKSEAGPSLDINIRDMFCTQGRLVSGLERKEKYKNDPV